MRVGVPQALFYHYYYPLWKTFFEDLGAEVVTSEETNRRTVVQGIQTAVDEACLPIKVFYGHVHELCRKDIDYLFVPRLVSIEPKSYICPKFMGIPDMIRAGFPNLPELIDITVDVSQSDKYLKRDIVKVGMMLGGSKKNILQAYQHGRMELKRCQELCRMGYSLWEAIKLWEGQEIKLARDYDLTIGVLGHGYSLYDRTISMNLIERLRGMGCQVRLAEYLNNEPIESEAAKMPKRVFWTLGRKMVGSALYMKSAPDIDGIIYLACFSCGPDSMIGEIIERKVDDKPFMMITIDEHTGEAGLVTRLEAFCDMLRRRRSLAGEDYLPAHGQYTYCR